MDTQEKVLTINEIKEEKKNVEDQIKQLIFDFETLTGIHVNDIEFMSVHRMGKTPQLIAVKLDVRLL